MGFQTCSQVLIKIYALKLKQSMLAPEKKRIFYKQRLGYLLTLLNYQILKWDPLIITRCSSIFEVKPNSKTR